MEIRAIGIFILFIVVVSWGIKKLGEVNNCQGYVESVCRHEVIARHKTDPSLDITAEVCEYVCNEDYEPAHRKFDIESLRGLPND